MSICRLNLYLLFTIPAPQHFCFLMPLTYLSIKSEDSASTLCPLIPHLQPHPRPPLHKSCGEVTSTSCLDYGGFSQPLNSKSKFLLNSDMSGEVSSRIRLQTTRVLIWAESDCQSFIAHFICQSDIIPTSPWFDSFRENVE